MRTYALHVDTSSFVSRKQDVILCHVCIARTHIRTRIVFQRAGNVRRELTVVRPSSFARMVNLGSRPQSKFVGKPQCSDQQKFKLQVKVPSPSSVLLLTLSSCSPPVLFLLPPLGGVCQWGGRECVSAWLVLLDQADICSLLFPVSFPSLLLPSQFFFFAERIRRTQPLKTEHHDIRYTLPVFSFQEQFLFSFQELQFHQNHALAPPSAWLSHSSTSSEFHSCQSQA